MLAQHISALGVQWAPHSQRPNLLDVIRFFQRRLRIRKETALRQVAFNSICQDDKQAIESRRETGCKCKREDSGYELVHAHGVHNSSRQHMRGTKWIEHDHMALRCSAVMFACQMFDVSLQSDARRSKIGCQHKQYKFSAAGHCKQVFDIKPRHC